MTSYTLLEGAELCAYDAKIWDAFMCVRPSRNELSQEFERANRAHS